MGATPRQRAFAAIANLNTLGTSEEMTQTRTSLTELGCLPDYKQIDTFIEALVDPLHPSAVPPLDGSDIPTSFSKVRTSWTVNPASATQYARGGQIFIPPGGEYRSTLSVYDIADPVSNTTSVGARISGGEEMTFFGGGDMGGATTTFPETNLTPQKGRVLAQTVRFEYIGQPSTCQGTLEVYIPDRRTQVSNSSGLSYAGFQNAPSTLSQGRSSTSQVGLDATHLPLAELLQRGSVDFHWLPQEDNDFKFINNSEFTPMILTDADTDIGAEVRARLNQALNGQEPLDSWDCGRVQIGCQTGIVIGNTSTILDLPEKLKYNAPWLCWFVTSCSDTSNAKIRVTAFTTYENRTVYTSNNFITNANHGMKRKCPIPGGKDFLKAASNMIRGSHHQHSRGTAEAARDQLRQKLGVLAGAHV